jgi:antitoxin (DNA-binding transcriptional repressor) of toxin-antitoxin stability system
MKATQLRANLYKTLDEVIATGKPVRVERKGKTVLLIPEQPVPKQRKFIRRKLLLVPDEEIIHIDWSKEWKYEK